MELPIRYHGWYYSCCLVTGNTVLLKPASTTPIIAYKFMEILEEAGFQLA